jgi:hypothetical protein
MVARIMRRFVLPVKGDSTPALFELRPRPSGLAPVPGKVSVTFWLDGAYLARATRIINIQTDQPASADQISAATPAGRRLVAGRATITEAETPPDLTVYVQESRVGDHTVCQLTIESPFLQPATAPCTPAEELRPWLSEQYNAILRASQRFRGVKLSASNTPASKEQVLAMLRGIGRELYRRAAGPLFDNAFWKLVDREQTEGEIARWHITEEVSPRDKPRERLALRQVAAIVPSYSDALALPHQSDEVTVLQQMEGFRRVEAQLSNIQQLLSSPDTV